MNINELRQLAGLKEAAPVQAPTTGSKEVNIGSGDWDRIANELGFKNKQEFIQAQLKSGTPDMKNALNNPNKYANQKIAFVGPDIATSTADQPVKQGHVPPKPKGTPLNMKVRQWGMKYGRTHNDDGSPKPVKVEPDKTGWVTPRPVHGALGRNWDNKHKKTHNPDGSPKDPASTIDDQLPDGTKLGGDLAKQTINITKDKISKSDAGKHILELISDAAKKYNCDRQVILAKLQRAGGKLVSKKV